MREFLLRFSSKNRQKVGKSESHDFTTKFNEPIKLSYDMKHEMAVRTISMTYSWYNIRQEYGNNEIKYSHNDGTNWETVTLIDGMYSYDDINYYLHEYMKDKGHIIKNGENDEYGINVTFVLSTYRILVEIKGDYQLDLRNSDFRKLIGFNSKLITQTEYGSSLPDITRGVDEVHVNCDQVTGSIVDGQNSSTVAVIPVENLTRSLPFNYNPRFLAYSPLAGHLISSMRFYLTDASGQPIDLNGMDWYIELFVRSMER